MGKYIKLFSTHAEYQAFIQTDDFILPNVSYCEDQADVVHYNPYVYDYSGDYLTFVALESGTFTFTPNNSNVISYSTDDGETWTTGNSVAVSNGDKVMWKGELTPSYEREEGIGTFSANGNFDVQGNVMSLLYGDNYKGQTDLTGKDYAFLRLFYNNTKVVNAENLSLSATTLASDCYNGMFNGCTNLISTPVLPATTLTNACYGAMFEGCTSLTTAPELPATTLAWYCYNTMFSGCTSLVSAPELPATTLANHCYSNMFYGCTSLNYIKAMFTTTPSSTYTLDWVSGVSATGTFVKNSAAQWNVTGIHGIPSGWTVETASA